MRSHCPALRESDMPHASVAVLSALRSELRILLLGCKLTILMIIVILQPGLLVQLVMDWQEMSAQLSPF